MNRILIILFATIIVMGVILFLATQNITVNDSVHEKNGCVVTGCSGHICANEEVMSTCEWKDEYACYREAVCERQNDGVCGWTETSELNRCLKGVI